MRTSPARRRRAAAITFCVIVGVGAAITIATMWLSNRLGAPGWFVFLVWFVPTAVVVVWVLARPRPAVPTDSDDDSWSGYAISYALVGEMEPRPAPARLVAAVVFGAPVGWAIVLLGVAALLGLAG